MSLLREARKLAGISVPGPSGVDCFAPVELPLPATPYNPMQEQFSARIQRLCIESELIAMRRRGEIVADAAFTFGQDNSASCLHVREGILAEARVLLSSRVAKT